MVVFLKRKFNLDIDFRELLKMLKDFKYLIRYDYRFLENSIRMFRDFEGK